MSLNIQRQAPLKFILAVLGLTAMAMVATAAIGYLVTSTPRGFIFWVMLGFLCTVQFLTGVIAVNIFTRSHCEYRPSSAILSITYGIVGAFAASGFLMIVVYWLVRDKEGSKDGFFTAVLMAITVFWFIVSFLLYSYDLHSQAVSRPAMQRRAEHKKIAGSISPLLSALRGFKTADDRIRSRVSIAQKKLESLDIALSHSHGGGTGSWEGGRQHPFLPEQEQSIQENIRVLEDIVHRLSSESANDIGAVLTELEYCIEKVSISLDLIELR